MLHTWFSTEIGNRIVVWQRRWQEGLNFFEPFSWLHPHLHIILFGLPTLDDLDGQIVYCPLHHLLLCWQHSWEQHIYNQILQGIANSEIKRKSYIQKRKAKNPKNCINVSQDISRHPTCWALYLSTANLANSSISALLAKLPTSFGTSTMPIAAWASKQKGTRPPRAQQELPRNILIDQWLLIFGILLNWVDNETVWEDNLKRRLDQLIPSPSHCNLPFHFIPNLATNFKTWNHIPILKLRNSIALWACEAKDNNWVRETGEGAFGRKN